MFTTPIFASSPSFCHETTPEATESVITVKSHYIHFRTKGLLSSFNALMVIDAFSFELVWKCDHWVTMLLTAVCAIQPTWTRFASPLQWRHNGRDGVSNHQPHDCLLNRLFRCRSKKTSKLRVTGLCAGNSPVTGEFPAQSASYADDVPIWWRHHASCLAF